MIKPEFKTVKEDNKNTYDYYLWLIHNGVLIEKLFYSSEKELSKETFDLYKSIIRKSFEGFNELLLKSIFDLEIIRQNIEVILVDPKPVPEFKIGELICIEDTKHLGRITDLAAENFLKVKLLMNTNHSSSYSYKSNLVKHYDEDTDICINTFVRYINPEHKFNNEICFVDRYINRNNIDVYDICVLNKHTSFTTKKEHLKNLNITNFSGPLIGQLKYSNIDSYFALMLANIYNDNDEMEYICCYNGCLQVVKKSNLTIINRLEITSNLVYIDSVSVKNLKYNRYIGYILEEKDDIYKLEFGNDTHEYKKLYCNSIDYMFNKNGIITI